MTATIVLPSWKRGIGADAWEETRERLDAEWAPLLDEKRRRVHGHAVIKETPTHMLGRTVQTGRSTTITIGTLPFSVSIIATRDGQVFGAIPRSTSHATRDDALTHARRALAQQGKRYARKYAS